MHALIRLVVPHGRAASSPKDQRAAELRERSEPAEGGGGAVAKRAAGARPPLRNERSEPAEGGGGSGREASRGGQGPPFLVLLIVLVVGCADPVHDSAVDALGPEAPGVPAGPTHRPGQPCLTCHGGEGPSSFVMSLGGTVYAQLAPDVVAEGVTVRIVDQKNRTFETTSNCAGNFWVPQREFEPTFPARAALTLGDDDEVMKTEMRDGSCNGCHVNPESASSPGHLWVLPAAATATAPECD